MLYNFVLHLAFLKLVLDSTVTDESFVDKSVSGVNANCSPGIYDGFVLYTHISVLQSRAYRITDVKERSINSISWNWEIILN